MRDLSESFKATVLWCIQKGYTDEDIARVTTATPEEIRWIRQTSDLRPRD